MTGALAGGGTENYRSDGCAYLVWGFGRIRNIGEDFGWME